MTTPGSQRTKLWRSVNKKKYSDYQREYMRKYRAGKNGENGKNGNPDRENGNPDVETLPPVPNE